MKSVNWLIVATFGILFSLVSLSHASEREFVILSHQMPPWHFIDEETKELAGINIDIVRYIFDNKIRIPVVFRQYPWTRAWHEIRNGRADALMTVSRKKPREPYVYYPEESLWICEYVFFVRRDKTDSGISGSCDEINKSGAEVGIRNGFSYDDNFWKFFPYADGSDIYQPDRRDYDDRLTAGDTDKTMFGMLAKSRFDVFLCDKSIGLYTLKMLKMQDIITHYSTVVFSKDYPMAFSKRSDYPGLKKIMKQFEKELVRLRREGKYTEIMNRWLQ